MDSLSLNTEEMFHSSMVRVKKAIRQIIISPGYKLIKADNSFEVFRIQMNVEDVSCLIFCSFFTMDSIRINGIFKVRNLPNGNLSEQELITLRISFINKFKYLLVAKPSLSRNYLHCEIKKTVSQNSVLLNSKSSTPVKKVELIKSVPYSSYSTKKVNNDFKWFWILFWIIIIVLAIALSKNGKFIHVDGYERTNGTHVHSYDRKP